MKKIFYAGLIGLALFEILNVYFIMPMPGSQRIQSINIAYLLYSHRWLFRGFFLLLILAGSFSGFKTNRLWIPVVTIIPVLVITYYFNFQMTADHMFLQAESLTFQSRGEHQLSDSSLVLAVTNNLEAKAYPIRYIQYHHQVRDTIAGKHIMVTYCVVCRTGRVFEPVVNGRLEIFRLVGMDHFNAMFEDETTRSWWRQATGEAITGTLKGAALPEVESSQYTLGEFFSLYPFGKVMEADENSRERYDTLGRFEKGKSQSKLTRTDSLSWKDKSWVLWVQLDKQSKAYDWIVLKKVKVINDAIGNRPIVVALASDEESFIAFERHPGEEFIVRNDSLVSATNRYDFAGRSADGSHVKSITAYQEFWHSARQFHPEMKRYEGHQ
jgi:hypothetical protein